MPEAGASGWALNEMDNSMKDLSSSALFFMVRQWRMADSSNTGGSLRSIPATLAQEMPFLFRPRYEHDEPDDARQTRGWARPTNICRLD